jgi:hypothetical protein
MYVHGLQRSNYSYTKRGNLHQCNVFLIWPQHIFLVIRKYYVKMQQYIEHFLVEKNMHDVPLSAVTYLKKIGRNRYRT